MDRLLLGQIFPPRRALPEERVVAGIDDDGVDQDALLLESGHQGCDLPVEAA